MNNTKQKTGELKCTSPIEVLFEGADTKIYGKTKDISDDLKAEMDKYRRKIRILIYRSLVTR